MVKEIVTTLERCVGCKACEITCAVEHSTSKTLFGAIMEQPRSQPRVRVQQSVGFTYPVRCMHCEDAPCIIACPTGAMHRHPVTDSVFVQEHRCIGCWMCVMVCPFGAVTANRSYQKVLKCDRCPDRVTVGRDPACVEACPTRALAFVPLGELVEQRQAATSARAVTAAAAGQAQANVQLWRALKERLDQQKRS